MESALAGFSQRRVKPFADPVNYPFRDFGILFSEEYQPPHSHSRMLQTVRKHFKYICLKGTVLKCNTNQHIVC